MISIDEKGAGSSNRIIFFKGLPCRFELSGICIEGIGSHLAPVVVGSQKMAQSNSAESRFKVSFKIDHRSKNDDAMKRFFDWFGLVKKAHPLVVYEQPDSSFVQLKSDCTASVALSENTKMEYEIQGVFPIAWKLDSLGKDTAPRASFEFSYDKCLRKNGAQK